MPAKRKAAPAKKNRDTPPDGRVFTPCAHHATTPWPVPAPTKPDAKGEYTYTAKTVEETLGGDGEDDCEWREWKNVYAIQRVSSDAKVPPVTLTLTVVGNWVCGAGEGENKMQWRLDGAPMKPPDAGDEKGEDPTLLHFECHDRSTLFVLDSLQYIRNAMKWPDTLLDSTWLTPYWQDRTHLKLGGCDDEQFKKKYDGEEYGPPRNSIWWNFPGDWDRKVWCEIQAVGGAAWLPLELWRVIVWEYFPNEMHSSALYDGSAKSTEWMVVDGCGVPKWVKPEKKKKRKTGDGDDGSGDGSDVDDDDDDDADGDDE